MPCTARIFCDKTGGTMLHFLKFSFWKKENEDRHPLNQIKDWLVFSERKRRDDAAALTARLDKLDRTLSELREGVNRHDLAVADMLDSWDEWRQSREEVDGSLLKAANEKARQEAAESQHRENALVSLAAACFDQFHMLRRSAKEAGDQTWLRQLELAEEKLSAERLRAGFQVIDDTGCEVNYSLYEIAAAVDTENPDLAMRIADVYSPGYAYRGSVLRKAQASAYRAVQGESDAGTASGRTDEVADTCGNLERDRAQKSVKEYNV